MPVSGSIPYSAVQMVALLIISHGFLVVFAFHADASPVQPYAAWGVLADNFHEKDLSLILRDECIARLDELGNVSDARGYLQRTFLSAGSVRARNLIREWMRDAGLKTWVDDMGNIHGRSSGANSSAAALLLGSHLDTVIDAGRYDGALGVISAIAAVKALKWRGELMRFPRPIEIVAFSDEEGVRFQSTFLGSGAIAGIFSPKILQISDARGTSLQNVLMESSFPGTEESLERTKYEPASVWGYVEVHIEQGPVLEAEGLPLGVVDAISGQTRLTVTLEGSAGHAGTVPMAMRKDPMMAAAQAILSIEELCKYPEQHLYSAPDFNTNTESLSSLVCTVGQLNTWPGASNVIPGQVVFSVDVRAKDDALRQIAVQRIENSIRSICNSRDISCNIENKHNAKAVGCAPALIGRLQEAVRIATWKSSAYSRHSTMRQLSEISVPMLSSGAGHDALAMAHLTQVGMVFVRCRAGVSHSPAEYVEDDDVLAGSSALYWFLVNELQSKADV